MHSKQILLFLAVLTGLGLSGCATTSSSNGDVKMTDTGYFLSMKQKGQLIGTGRIQDEQGMWYDVRIVPGYVQPAKRTKKYVGIAGRDFAEYGQAKKYQDLAKDSGDALEWAYDDCLVDFTVKGLSRAYKQYWSAANERTKKRVFGWWMAYPWAFLESTVDTVVRVPVGLAGTAVGTVLGIAIVPGYHAVDSAVSGTWNLSVNAVLLPAVGCTWNTVVAPPMSIVGQKPAPSRVDGFWVKALTSEDIRADTMLATPISPEDVEALAVWGRLLLDTSQPFEARRQALRKNEKAEREAIRQRSEEAETVIRREEQVAIRTVVPDSIQQEAIEHLQGHYFDSNRTRKTAQDVRQHLRERTELSSEEINRIMNLLIRYPPSDVTNLLPIRGKTDPVGRSIEVIKDL